MNVDLAKMFPEAARRVEVLEGLRKSWAVIVGPVLARCSWPNCLGVNELCISVRNEQAGSMLSKTKGNIVRAMDLRFGYEAGKDFALKITTRTRKKHRPRVRRIYKNTASSVDVDDETVNRYMNDAPETLPEDINYSLSHLKAFLEKRFPRKE